MTVPLEEGAPLSVREVWSHNLDAEFKLISQIVHEYPFVALDTEFPGVVVPQQGHMHQQHRHTQQDNLSRAYDNYCRADALYQCLRANVDCLKLIQLGLTFTDARGRLPFVEGSRCAAWQFNFCEFDVHNDLCAPDAIQLLEQSGIDFDKNRLAGIACTTFAGLLLRSGLVKNISKKRRKSKRNNSKNIKQAPQPFCLHYISFHGAYDFAYLLKVLTGGKPLPAKPEEFINLINTYFGTFYDLKYMMRFCYNLYGGLNALADALHVERKVGSCHQAGSDSLLTSLAFHKLRDTYFKSFTEMYSGVLYNLEI